MKAHRVQRVTFALVPGERIEPGLLHPAGTRLRPKGGVWVVRRWCGLSVQMVG